MPKTPPATARQVNRRGVRGRTPVSAGSSIGARRVVILLDSPALKMALVNEAGSLVLDLSDYCQRVLFSMSPTERIERATSAALPGTDK